MFIFRIVVRYFRQERERCENTNVVHGVALHLYS